MQRQKDRHAIEQYILANPGQTIPEIRQNLHRLRGWSTEKISARIAEIAKYREILSVPTEHNLHRYSLGNFRPNAKLLGVTANVRVVRDTVHTTVKIHQPAVEDHSLYLVTLEIQTAIQGILAKHHQTILDAATVVTVLPPTFTQSYDTSIYDLIK